MNSNAHKGPVLSRTLLAQSIIAELQAEAQQQRRQVQAELSAQAPHLQARLDQPQADVEQLAALVEVSHG